jgi:hypothetical protein
MQMSDFIHAAIKRPINKTRSGDLKVRARVVTDVFLLMIRSQT